MIETRTQSGVPVKLEGIEQSGRPMVQASCVVAGKPRAIVSDRYGSPRQHPEVRGILGTIYEGRIQDVCLTVPEADYQAALAEAKAIGERELADLREGRVPITVHYHDGEYLSGHAVHGRAAELLAGLGLAKRIEGWGYLVETALVDQLGTSFAYEEAAACAAPALAAKRAKEQKVMDVRREKFAEAARTGRRVLLCRDTDECDGSVDECSLDIVHEYALPDGSTKVERTHTF